MNSITLVNQLVYHQSQKSLGISMMYCVCRRGWARVWIQGSLAIPLSLQSGATDVGEWWCAWPRSNHRFNLQTFLLLRPNSNPRDLVGFFSPLSPFFLPAKTTHGLPNYDQVGWLWSLEGNLGLKPQSATYWLCE